MTMQTIEIHVPENIYQYFEVLNSNREEFVLKAIEEKLNEKIEEI